MQQKMNNLLRKMRHSAENLADRTEEAASHAVDLAGRTASDVVESTKLNKKIFDLNSDIDQLYLEIGKMLYDTHQGKAIEQDIVQEKLTQLDEKHEEIAALREKLSRRRRGKTCPVCGKECKADSTFCSECGARL
jgi:DNA repair exonuclease SbcCD ATPase subunit